MVAEMMPNVAANVVANGVKFGTAHNDLSHRVRVGCCLFDWIVY